MDGRPYRKIYKLVYQQVVIAALSGPKFCQAFQEYNFQQL